ncbi:GNAT family N-acetyltransferase [Oceanirhabdus sp. W0125-5]|uniref:GNAT family N-acetyltransferase n=1 Tax=Oceanirhabdus sp. W0125-5 TaxID=2999116 RepID=UPI0022F2BCDC|nr:GNAT family protein [Oceanirhabdus sp. W0125-5]WBW95987.1 GNAT family protein [Oceanirhabdus sp. W0125-5]
MSYNSAKSEMRLEYRVPIKSDVEDILTWEYEGIYSFYNNNVSKEKIEFIKSFIDSDNDFSIYNEFNELIGNCSFYYIGEFFCLGVQMRPTITGKGFGTEFVKSIIEFGKEKYNLSYIDLTVAKFNKRAIKVYDKLGFEVVEEFVNTIRGVDYDFIAMRLNFDY